MKFYKVIHKFTWGETLPDYCVSELGQEEVLKKISQTQAGKANYVESLVEQVEKPSEIWLKRQIESVENLLKFYKQYL